MYSIYKTNCENAKLAYPHYTDSRWNKAQVIFGEQSKDLSYDYSDRLTSSNYDKDKRARAKACKEKEHSTAGWWKVYLEEYFDQKVYLGCILAGSNLANGYPYWVLGYKLLGKSDE